MADLAWAAGVLDSQGQWVAARRKTKNGVSYTMRVRVRVSVTREDVLYELRRILGGHFSTGVRSHRSEWSVSGAKACLDLHETLAPYLKIRARLSQAHATACRSITEWTPAGMDRTVPPEALAEREVLLEAVRHEAGRVGAYGGVLPQLTVKTPDPPAGARLGPHDVPF